MSRQAKCVFLFDCATDDQTHVSKCIVVRDYRLTVTLHLNHD